MIQSIYVNNFKSLRECRLDLDKLTCLVGLNGAGKSTLLQARPCTIHFIFTSSRPFFKRTIIL